MSIDVSGYKELNFCGLQTLFFCTKNSLLWFNICAGKYDNAHHNMLIMN